MRRLRGCTLVDAGTGSTVTLRGGRGPRVILVAHSADCAGCHAYMTQLAAHMPEFAEWGGRVSVVVHEPPPRAGRLHPGFSADVQVLLDPDAAFDVRPAAVVVADEWGEIHFALEGVADHALPPASELIEWARFIAIQCPECEQPEGAWRNV